MYTIQWTREAESDLENILAYYAERLEIEHVDAIAHRIVNEIASLREFPNRCRMGRVSGTRELVISRLPFIAVVVVDADTVSVWAVVHTAQEYPPSMK
jgi:toxin ParE1/3/4